MNNKTCVIYARQSITQGDGESTSIEVQIENCRRWANSHSAEVIGVFSDADTPSEAYPLCESGIENAKVDRGWLHWKAEQRTTRRAEYKEGLGKAFDLIAKRHPDYLIVNTGNRLGRSAHNSNLNNYLTAYLVEHRCSVVDVCSNNVTDFSDTLMVAFRALKDALDYQGVFEKRKASIESVSKRINSYTKWSNAMGVVMKDGQVTFDPAYAEVIRYVYNSLVDGATYGTILHKLNTSYRHLVRKQWYITNVRSILRNPVYSGYMRNREGVLGKAVNIPEPVVSYSVWQRAQEAMETKRTNGQKYNGKHHHFLPLSGYLFCPCGRRMTLFVDRGKIAYHCINRGEHKTAIYITEDVLLTIQSVFMIGLTTSHKRLQALKTASNRVDDLRSEILRLKASQVAKMRLVETEEDVAVYKPVIDSIKATIRSKQEELARLEGELSADSSEAQRRLEEDFHAIMEGQLLPEDTYMRLMQECIDKITVHSDHIDIVTKTGVTIPVPRLEGKHHSKRLMRCALICDTTDGTLEGLIHYQLHLHDGEPEIVGGESVYQDENMSVSVHWPEEYLMRRIPA